MTGFQSEEQGLKANGIIDIIKNNRRFIAI